MLLLVARKIRSMIIAFQLTFFALIVTSSILWIVYFVFASCDDWSSNKKNYIFEYIIMDWVNPSYGYLIRSYFEHTCPASKNETTPPSTPFFSC